MKRLAPLSRVTRPLRQRAAAILVLGLQMAIMGSAIWEPRTEVRLGAHVEQDGARHANLHNEATCALCSARSQTYAPELAPAVVDAPQVISATVTDAYAAPDRAAPSLKLSRAPPARST